MQIIRICGRKSELIWTRFVDTWVWKNIAHTCVGVVSQPFFRRSLHWTRSDTLEVWNFKNEYIYILYIYILLLYIYYIIYIIYIIYILYIIYIRGLRLISENVPKPFSKTCWLWSARSFTDCNWGLVHRTQDRSLRAEKSPRVLHHACRRKMK